MERLIENRGQYLYIKLSGEFDMQGFEPGFPKLLKILKETGISKILLDCRDMSGNYSRTDRFYINEWLAIMNISYMDKDHPTLKIVAVLDPSMFDPQRFGETVAKTAV